MDGCVYPYRHVAPAATHPFHRRLLGIAEDAIVIGAFVSALKLSRRCLALWRDVLARVPRARLAFSPNHPALRGTYERIAAAAGIAAERLLFLPQGRDDAENQARYGLVDFVLDPMPYGGVNGTLEALDMGVPVVTLIGKAPRRADVVFDPRQSRCDRHHRRERARVRRHRGAPRRRCRVRAPGARGDSRGSGAFGADRHAGAHAHARAGVPRRARGKGAGGARRRRDGIMADARIGEAEALLRGGDPARAAALLSAALAVSNATPDDRRAALMLRSRAREALADLPGAIADLREAIVRHPGDPRLRNALGILLADAGDARGAGDEFSTAVRLDPGYARAWNNLGNALRSGGRVAEAAQAVRRAVAAQPDYALAWSNLGTILQDLGDEAGARDALRRALELKPDPRTLQALAALARQRGDVDEAALLYARAAVLAPADTTILLSLAGVLAERDDLAAACSAYPARVRAVPRCCARRSARR